MRVGLSRAYMCNYGKAGQFRQIFLQKYSLALVWLNLEKLAYYSCLNSLTMEGNNFFGKVFFSESFLKNRSNSKNVPKVREISAFFAQIGFK